MPHHWPCAQAVYNEMFVWMVAKCSEDLIKDVPMRADGTSASPLLPNTCECRVCWVGWHAVLCIELNTIQTKVAIVDSMLAFR